ncbi:PTPLA-domain-containing protein [Sporormia fimetaria CBS 119925]|uniref:Very-long-chain (3R)-3-hydroxyacyl-CoA dehydratase n=1 Tax=Sporormia fimetaria CBS 119925 TaxID=1340428 RepID=A0A6A6V1K8_9PLEO|nr:PTPLA-domain-containing protein [Sporormia fimetaria CBS 119925]
MPPKTAATKSASNPPALTNYLRRYNLVSSILWLSILVRVLKVGCEKGFDSGVVYDFNERYARLIQTGAVLEVLHSLTGLVRAPVMTTLMQVASRLLLVWGIGYNFPASTRNSPAYASMLVAWSVTEVIRYSYFVFVLAGKGVPGFLTWLRYNTFFVLYPLGVASETWLIYRAIPAAQKLNPAFAYALWGILATYIPGFYTLFTHMLRQRSKVMKAKRV